MSQPPVPSASSVPSGFPASLGPTTSNFVLFNLNSVKYTISEISKDVNQIIYEHTPLHWTCYCGNLDGIKWLLVNGADVNKKGAHDRTVLVSTCQRLDGDIDHDTFIKILKLLLEAGADLSIKDDDGMKAIHFTVKSIEASRLLIAEGADVDACCDSGSTPLIHAMFWAELSGSSESFQFFLENGADPTKILIDGHDYKALVSKISYQKMRDEITNVFARFGY
jgi:ankyrin repeat protein